MRQLFIDSRDRTTGSTTDFTIQLRETLSTTGGVNFFRIDELRVPLVIPLIQAGVNDTFWYSLGGYIKSVTLAAGNYSGTDLAVLPEDTWTVSYNNHLASLSVFCTDQTFLALNDAAVVAAGHTIRTFASTLFQNAAGGEPARRRSDRLPGAGRFPQRRARRSRCGHDDGHGPRHAGRHRRNARPYPADRRYPA